MSELTGMLKPCPFCGKDKHSLWHDGDGTFLVQCDYCEATCQGTDFAQAILRWDARQPFGDRTFLAQEVEERE